MNILEAEQEIKVIDGKIERLFKKLANSGSGEREQTINEIHLMHTKLSILLVAWNSANGTIVNNESIHLLSIKRMMIVSEITKLRAYKEGYTFPCDEWDSSLAEQLDDINRKILSMKSRINIAI